MRRGRHGKRSEIATKRLGRWLREKVGVTDRRVTAAHSWRHWAKDALRRAGVPEEAQDDFLGHDDDGRASRSYGVGYRAMPAGLFAHISKMRAPLETPPASEAAVAGDARLVPEEAHA